MLSAVLRSETAVKISIQIMDTFVEIVLVDHFSTYAIFGTTTSTSMENIVSLKSNNTISTFPNPFNPQTRISYNLNKTGNLIVDILNINGTVVKNLTNRVVTAGNFSVNWNGVNASGSQVASGIYIVRISHNNKVLSKIIKLIK